MFTSNYKQWTRGRQGLDYGSDRHAWQWQPTTYGASAAHDPSPPIILEDAPAVGGVTYAPLNMMMGMGC